MPGNVVLGYDGSDGSRAALEVAARVAGAFRDAVWEETLNMSGFLPNRRWRLADN